MSILANIYRGLCNWGDAIVHKGPYYYQDHPPQELKMVLHHADSEVWSSSLGTTDDVPPIPQPLLDKLKEPCPFWPGSSIEETHILILIPKLLNGTPFSLQLLSEIAAEQLPDSQKLESKYGLFDSFFDTPMENSEWILMTKGPIPNSHRKIFDEQKAELAHHGYRLPKLLEISVCSLLGHLAYDTGLYLSSNLESSYCLETDSSGFPIIAGFDPADGISITLNDANAPSGAGAVFIS